jgi:hypothetical protein
MILIDCEIREMSYLPRFRRPYFAGSPRIKPENSMSESCVTGPKTIIWISNA